MTYQVAELFYSLQGEGARKGTANVFVRFAGCNLSCSRDEEGFDCDTDFKATRVFETAEQLVEGALTLWPRLTTGEQPCVILTGGEPALQVDDELVAEFMIRNCYLAIETNGTRELPGGIDWISVSPKRGHDMVLKHAHEIRIVVDAQGRKPLHHEVPFIPGAVVYLSPAYGEFGQPCSCALETAIQACLWNPEWRLSTQDHKYWGIR